MSRVLALPLSHRAMSALRAARAGSRRGLARAVTIALLVAAAAGSLPLPAEAQSGGVGTWTLNNGLWSQTSSWEGGTVANGTTAGYFASSTLTGDITARRTSGGAAYGLTFDYAGGTVRVTGTGSNASLSIGVGGITMTSVSGPVNIGVSGDSNVTLDLALSGSQTWRNDSLSSLLSIGNLGSGVLNMGTVGNVLTIGGSGATWVQRVVSGTGSIVKQDPGLLRLSGVNTFNGGLTLQGGTLRLDSNSALGTGTFTVTGGSIDVGADRSLSNAMNWNGDFAFIST